MVVPANVTAWQLAEDAAFWLFRYQFALPTTKLGAEALFQHEPEGLVIGIDKEKKHSLIYECKCRSAPYRMTHDDFLRYQSYIVKMRRVADSLHSRLTNFVIFAPTFAGSCADKLRALSQDGTNVTGVTWQRMRDLYRMTDGWSLGKTAHLDLPYIFQTGVLRKDRLWREIRRAETSYNRYV